MSTGVSIHLKTRHLEMLEEVGGGSLCTTFQLHNIRCVHSKSDWHFDGQSNTNFLKGLLYPLSKSDSPSNGVSLKKKNVMKCD